MKLMVDANDDPQTPAYKEIEQLVEAQVPYTPVLETLPAISRVKAWPPINVVVTCITLQTPSPRRLIGDLLWLF